MPKAKSKTNSGVVCWWLGEGDEQCPHCGQPYLYEFEIRCADCDGPCCAHCQETHAADDHVCPECVATGEEARPQGGRKHGKSYLERDH